MGSDGWGAALSGSGIQRKGQLMCCLFAPLPAFDRPPPSQPPPPRHPGRTCVRSCAMCALYMSKMASSRTLPWSPSPYLRSLSPSLEVSTCSTGWQRRQGEAGRAGGAGEEWGSE